jgi:2',3'-cyclic-nucleotide 2'-phosphodiesterase (5'-nucleotidase family)
MIVYDGINTLLHTSLRVYSQRSTINKFITTPPYLYRLSSIFMILMILSLSHEIYAHPQSKQNTLVIFHTSDMHGYILPHKARGFNKPRGTMIGGFATLARVVRQETHPYVLLDSGDFFQGAPEGTLSKGSSVVHLMNQLAYDASVIGNHEYDFGEKNLIALEKQAHFPLLAANIQQKSNGVPVKYARAWALIQKGQWKIGVVGLSTRFTSTATLPTHVEHLRFIEEVAAARPHVDALRAAGADIVIALTHCGVGPSVARKRVQSKEYQPTPEDLAYPGDLLIAKTGGFDLVLGGHAHAAFSEPWQTPNGVPVVQSGEHLEHVSRLEISKDPSGKLSITGKLLPLWVDQYGQDEEMQKEVEKVTKVVKKQMQVVIAKAEEDLLRFVDPPHLDGPLPNLFCDEMARVAKSDIALHNSFGLRADLVKGDVTVGHLYKIMPFENTLAVMTLSGTDLIELLAHNFKGGVSRLQVSHHLQVQVVQPSMPANTTIKVLYQGKEIMPQQIFKVAMNSYMASGGSCCQALKALPHDDTGISLRVLFMDLIKKLGQVKAPKTGRIILAP